VQRKQEIRLMLFFTISSLYLFRHHTPSSLLQPHLYISLDLALNYYIAMYFRHLQSRRKENSKRM